MQLDLKSEGTGIFDFAQNAIAAGYQSGESYQIDRTPPVITIFGANPVQLGPRFILFRQGAMASDETDGYMTSSIVTTGLPVEIDTVGTQYITYTATDSAEISDRRFERSRSIHRRRRPRIWAGL